MTSSAERRPKRRKTVLLTGIIAHSAGETTLPCTIRDLSDSGARVSLAKSVELPSDFYLINMRDRVAYDARRVWTEGEQTGVTFKQILPLSDVTDPGLRFLKRLWLSRAG